MKNPLTKATQQRQAPRVGSIGAALLVVSSVVSYMLEMPVIAVIGGIIGLVCIGFALYNVIKPSTKLEEVENIKKHSQELPIITP